MNMDKITKIIAGVVLPPSALLFGWGRFFPEPLAQPTSIESSIVSYEPNDITSGVNDPNEYHVELSKYSE